MSTFSYPELSRKDMVAILAESQIVSISEADLLNPTPDFVSSLYTALLIHLDFLPEDHGQVDFAALEKLDNPDLHMEAVRTVNLFNKIKDILAFLNCPKNFMLKDLIRPETNRTELFVSAILNFCLHKDSKMNLLRPIVDELSLFDEQQKELEARISQLNAEISQHNEAREQEIPLVQEIDAKVKELRQTIHGLNNHQVSLKATFRSKKEKVIEMDEKISSAEFALVQSVQENANLRSKLVQSPEKLQRALEEKKSILAEAKNSENLALQSFQEKTAMVEVYTKACKKISKHLTRMQNAQEQVNSLKKIEKDVKALKLKLSEEVMLDKSLEATIVEKQGRAAQLDESGRHDTIRDESTKELNNVKLEAESMRRDMEARQRNVQAVLAEVDDLNLKINKVKELGAAKKNELFRKSEEIVKEFHEYWNSIGSLLPGNESGA